VTGQQTAAPTFVEPPPVSYGADITRRSPVGQTRQERKFLSILEDHRAWLRERVESGELTVGGEQRCRAEAAALSWALARVAELERLEAEREPTPRRELAFSARKKEALALAEELGGEAVNVPSRRGWVILEALDGGG
jgi:hypothetical protein